MRRWVITLLLPLAMIAFTACNRPVELGEGEADRQSEPAVAALPSSFQRLTMLDGQMAWATGPGVVYRSTDGGAHWTVTRLGEAGTRSACRVDLDLPTATEGWMLRSTCPSLGYMAKELYHSQDGGQSWALVACECPGMDLTAHPWMMGGMYTTGMIFRDEATGWVTGSYHGADPIPIYRTEDGGMSWEVQQLPLPMDLEPIYYGNGMQPILFGQERERGVLPIGISSDRPYIILFFSTTDGGRTWVPGGRVEAPLCSSACKVVAADPEHLWLLETEGTLRRSTDGGMTWEALGSGWNLADVSFGSATDGLGLARDDHHLVLVRSSDGGATWRLVQAEIVWRD